MLFVTGCSGGGQFPTFNARSSETALIELNNRYLSVNNFNADAEFNFKLKSEDMTTDRIQIRLNGEVAFSREEGWEIIIYGPLGIKLAIINSNNGRYRINTPQTGQIKEGSLEDGLFIPNLEMMLPSISSLDILFLNWRKILD